MNVAYESLLRHGRAVQYHRRRRGYPAEHWLELQLAGEQNPDGSVAAFWVGFASKRDAKRNMHGMLASLRALEADGQINTDVRYNAIVRAVAAGAKRDIERQNADVLARAEAAVRGAPSLYEVLASRFRRDQRERTERAELRAERTERGENDGDNGNESW